MPELDDTLSATHSAVESAKVCYASPQLEDSAPAGSLESCFGRPVTESQVTAAQRDTVPVNTKESTNWAVNVWRGWVQVPEADVLSSRRASSTYSYFLS